MKKVLLFIILIISCTLFAAQISVADETSEYYDPATKIGLDVVFGFSNIIKRDSYNQAVFFIRNDGDDFSGKLSVKTLPGFRTDLYAVDSKNIFLPKMSKKRIYIDFFCDKTNFTAPLFFELQNDRGEKIFSHDLVDEKKISIINNYSTGNVESGFLTVVISDNNYGYNFLTGINTEAYAARARTYKYIQLQEHNVAYPSYDALPEESRGYDGVNLIILSSVTASKLSHDQKNAIIRYLHEGGNILITKSENNLWLQDEFMTGLLPGRLTGGTKTLDTIGGYDFVNAASEAGVVPEILNEPYEILDIIPEKRDAVFASYKGIPMILKKKEGDGSVYMTAFDPSTTPFAGRKETLDILGRLYSTLELKIGVSAANDSNNSATAIFNNMLSSIMNREEVRKVAIFFLITLLLYIFLLGPLNYIWLKRIRKLHYAWVTIPLISLIFSVFLMTSAFIARGNKNYLFTYNFIKVFHSDNFKIKSFMSVFSSTENKYDIEIEPQNLAVKFHQIADNPAGEYEVLLGDMITVNDVEIKKWSVKNFNIDGYVYENSDYMVSLVKNQKTFELVYDLPFEIDRIFYVKENTVFNIKTDSLGKKGELSLKEDEFKGYKNLTVFSNSDLVDFSTGSYLKEFTPTTASNEGIIDYLWQKNLIDTRQEYFFAFVKAPAYKYELVGAKADRFDKTLLIIPVEN